MGNAVTKQREMFVYLKQMLYLCYCYPEYNLFTLKRLIPIE